MIERYIIGAAAEDPGQESPAESRERLKELFPRGATRRMTQLGLLIGSVLRDLAPGETDSIVYATRFAENQALQEYLASFPTPSPTLFQTSIHPSAVQQVLIARQQPVRELFPLTGNAYLGAHGLQTALLTPAARVILCGGEERGSWLREQGSASEETFTFALALTAAPAGAIGRAAWWPDAPSSNRVQAQKRPEPARSENALHLAPDRAGFTLRELFEHVRDRRNLRRALAIGGTLEVTWG